MTFFALLLNSMKQFLNSNLEPGITELHDSLAMVTHLAPE